MKQAKIYINKGPFLNSPFHKIKRLSALLQGVSYFLEQKIHFLLIHKRSSLRSQTFLSFRMLLLVYTLVFQTCWDTLYIFYIFSLTAWPLIRDVFFYAISLALLVGFFLDNEITWYEALLLFLWYFAYVGFMKFNEPAEDKLRALFKLPEVVRKPPLLMHA